MKESVTYQEIVDEGRVEGLVAGRVAGRVEGRIEGEQRAILRQGTRRFGPPEPAVLARLNAITDLDELDRLTLDILTASNWAELLG